MPKLRLQDVERNQKKIEDAALRVFTRLGFHGTSVRDIAKEAQVSIGNLYNYYRTKEEIFTTIIARYETHMEKLRRKALGGMHAAFEPDELLRMAHVIREIVYDNPDYWRLMYIDITEFGNQHFAGTFRSLAKNMKQRLGPQLEASTRTGTWNRCVDPALAFTAIYLQLFTYFLVEKLFGGKQHLGVSDDRAVTQLIKIATEGLWIQDGKGKRHSRRKVK
ncbi:MAG: TetR/AcrR family transcriptional regulator [Terriglobales bacterium]